MGLLIEFSFYLLLAIITATAVVLCGAIVFVAWLTWVEICQYVARWKEQRL